MAHVNLHDDLVGSPVMEAKRFPCRHTLHSQLLRACDPRWKAHWCLKLNSVAEHLIFKVVVADGCFGCKLCNVGHDDHDDLQVIIHLGSAYVEPPQSQIYLIFIQNLGVNLEL